MDLHPPPSQIKELLQLEASRLGFQICRITGADPLPGGDFYRRWVGDGKAGTMRLWMEKSMEYRDHPSSLLPDARSLIILGFNYFQHPPSRRGSIATYALGLDYHDLLRNKLSTLDHFLRQQGGTQKIAVDTSPLLEKQAATRAGAGWIGKSTMLIHPRMGTWLFLSEILTTLALKPDHPISDRCGQCDRCIQACPTGAIHAPYQLDARRCISYLTIEHQGSIPLKMRPLIGDHLYGCDDCLTACPWNRWAVSTQEPALQSIRRPDLREMLSWEDERFRREFRGTPIFRLKRPRWLRNIAVVLGNIGSEDDIPALQKASSDPDPLIREHAQWAQEVIQLRLSG